MKKILTLSLATAFGITVMAQEEPKRVCGTLEHEKYLDQQDPTRVAQKAAYAKAMNKWLESRKNDPSAKNQQTTTMIPLVVHMVYSSASDSVSDAQIFSQIQILNDDFTRQNADKANTPSTFTAVASAPMVNYCWAQRDPNGNATNGIERRKSTTTSWSTNDAVKHASSGGMDAWDPSKYFNIWVCSLQSPLLGYGEFPTGSLSQTYGFVATNTAFGNTGMAQAPFNKGRTATHEIGHCFNLIHIWGDEPNCTGSDQCADTPNQASENYNCPTYPQVDACSATSPGVMFMNYMDYTDDGCMNMFTANQASRMTAVINNPPYNSLLTSNGCTPVAVVPLDAGISAITKPSGSLGCTATFTPNVTVKNYGTTALTSCKINYKVDGGSVSQYNWSGNLAANATATVNLPAVTATAGTHTFTAYTSAPNGGTDGQTTNDTYTSNFSVIGATGMTMPLTEGFEGVTFPPSGWSISNPDNGTTWARTTAAAKTGVASAFMDNYNYNASGQVDELIAPSVNLTSGTNQVLTFQVAYELYTNPTSNPNFSDTLNVMISTNCGSTYTSIYKKFSTTLATTNPTFATTSFVPTSSQWRLETVSLSPYNTAIGAIVKFHHTTDYENQMYIDDVNISASMGINVYAALAGISIYPNPSSDGRFFVDVKQGESHVQKLGVYDVLGNKVYGIDQNIPVGFYEMNLDNLSNGTYLVEIIKDNKPVYTKIVINK